LHAEGVTGSKGTHILDFLSDLHDDWIFYTALSDLSAVKQMHQQREFLCDDCFAQLVQSRQSFVKYLLLDGNAEQQLDEPSDADVVE
jgi:hypothetical protein